MGEVHVMAWLSQMLGARLAGMVIGHIKTTRVTSIPVGEASQNRKRLVLNLNDTQ
jgi:hypothetical protein